MVTTWNQLLEILESAPDRQKVVVAFSFTTMESLLVQSQVKTLKERYTSKPLVFLAGGAHATGVARQTLAMGFDLVVRGEGEEAIGQVIHCLLEKEDFSQVPGISYTDGSGSCVHVPSNSPPVELDRFPPFALKRRQIGPVEITRGCPFVCSFCQTSHLMGARPRHRSIEAMGRLVEEMCGTGLQDLRVITPNAFSYGSENGRELNLERLEALLKEVRGVLGRDRRFYFGSFPSEVRPEHVNETTIGLLKKYADNKDLIIGAQSGSDRMLKACHRGHGVEEVVEAVSLARKAGYQVSTDFIFGLPGERAEDIEATFDLIDQLIEMGAKIHAHAFMPLPMTRFAEEPVEPLSEKVLAGLGRYLHRGHIFGNWREQMKR